MKSEKILKGVEQICDYGKFSKALFADLMKMGLPVARVRGIWWAHADNIDEFFRHMTLQRQRHVPDPAEIYDENPSELFDGYQEKGGA